VGIVKRDITYCNGRFCLMRDKCERFIENLKNKTKGLDGLRVSISDFSYTADFDPKECEYFIKDEDK
jgi:hypothetical protein